MLHDMGHAGARGKPASRPIIGAPVDSSTPEGGEAGSCWCVSGLGLGWTVTRAAMWLAHDVRFKLKRPLVAETLSQIAGLASHSAKPLEAQS
jgi:hypothetical protein